MLDLNNTLYLFHFMLLVFKQLAKHIHNISIYSTINTNVLTESLLLIRLMKSKSSYSVKKLLYPN